ncbi:MAG: hypothetical protein ACRD93_09715, partial [Nitrososphaeraceae archaeon]
MSIEQALQEEIEESKKWLNIEKDESTYKRDLQKRIELINWVLENMNNPDIPICDNIESRIVFNYRKLLFSRGVKKLKSHGSIRDNGINHY